MPDFEIMRKARDSGPIIPWSFSKMQALETCPRKYQAQYVTKEVPYVESPHLKWGNEVHKALEHYIRYGTPMPSNVAQYKGYADAVKSRWGHKGQIIAERQVALNSHLMETGYFDGDVWLRAKLDVTILMKTTAVVLDWKTGKVRDDPKQLMFYAMLVFCMYPDVERVQAGYVFLEHDMVTPPVTFVRGQFEQMLNMWAGKYIALVDEHNAGVFPPKPSGLCNGWCEVTSCEHWRPKRK